VANTLVLSIQTRYTTVQDTQPRIAFEHTPQGQCAVLHGRWTAQALAVLRHWSAVQRARQAPAASAPTTVWDLRALQRLDHVGAQLLWNAWGRSWPQHLHALEGQRATLERVALFTVAAQPPRRVSVWSMFLKLGGAVLGVADHVMGATRLLGQLFLDIGRLLRAPAKGPWRDISSHLYHIGASALPITALVGFLIGVVLAYLMSQQLRQFGADAFIVNILGLSIIRELGPVLAAILIAGRSGSAITAQIGVMRVTEELDALQVMGVARGFRLVMPRALAMALAMPLVSVWTTLAALLGGVLASDLTMGLTPAYFASALPKAVELSNLWLALGKSVVFGVLIALIGCHYGLRVKANTASLGQGTTASVVTSITAVLIVDALFAVVFKGVGV
jgi:phospholipid/cholesterol/gamma-HCH transport system permease protein